MDISCILPAYNEAENLKWILPQIHRELKSLALEYEILIVDTMEKLDDTDMVVSTGGAVYVRREGGNLYGDAIRTGLKRAQGKYIVIMDADGSHNPHDIVRFYNEMQKKPYSLIIGSRYCKNGHTNNNCVLIFMSWLLNVTYRILFGLRIKDISNSYRMYRAEYVKNLSLECSNFDIVEEILIKLKYTIPDFTVLEVPITFDKRRKGESKRDLVKFVKSYLKTIKRLMAIKRKL